MKTQGSMMLVISLTLGGLLGEWIDLDGRFEAFGTWLRHKSRNDGDSLFIDGFVTSSLTVCIGAMAIIGAIEDGIYGNYSILAAKAVLDLCIILVLSASLGKGCIFSAIPVGIWQGLLTLLAVLIEPVFTQKALDNLSLSGNVMIFAVGLNLIRKERIRVANLLPGLLIAVLWAFIPALNGL